VERDAGAAASRAAEKHACINARATPRPRASGATPSIRMCASSRSSGGSSSASIRSPSSSVAEPTMRPSSRATMTSAISARERTSAISST
jgi:hypothetical protein